MAALLVPSWTINNVCDDVLQRIKYGDIEDIVSKDRVCKRFKSTNDSILMTRKELATIGNHEMKDYIINYPPEFVMKVFERMEKLTDGSQLGLDRWTASQVERLAVANPNLTKLWPVGPNFVQSKYRENFKRYISAVKENNSSYTGKDVKHIFQIEVLIDSEDEMNLNRHSDLQLKIISRDENIVQYDEMGAKVLYQLWLHSGDRVQSRHPSVKELLIGFGYESFDDLKFVPNTEAVTLLSPRKAHRLLNEVFSNFGTKLKQLVIVNCRGMVSRKWTESGTSSLRLIINNSPLKVLEIEDTGEEGINIMDSILTSPRRTLKRISLDDRGGVVDTIKIKGDNIAIKSLKYWNNMRDIILRFKRINRIFFTNAVDISQIRSNFDDLRQLRDRNRRRALKIQFKGDRNDVVLF